jgi:putative transposase
MSFQPAGGSALRKGRVSLPNQTYLITVVTRDRQPLFSDLSIGREVVHALRSQSHAAETLCFVIMPDHLHWLLRLERGSGLSRVVGAAKGRSSREIRRRLGLGSSVWQPGFHDRALRSDEDLLPTARYVVANPLRAGLVTKLGEYPLWDAVWVGADTAAAVPADVV